MGKTNTLKLSDKTAVVTGGGRGIGAAVARSLASAGARVLVAARTAAQVDEISRKLRDAGLDVTSATVDVSDPDSVARLAALAKERLGKVDILVNNAGIATSAPLKALELEEWNRILSINATGTYLCTRAFAIEMAERNWGRVVNVASVASRVGAPYISAYTASKHAVPCAEEAGGVTGQAIVIDGGGLLA